MRSRLLACLASPDFLSGAQRRAVYGREKTAKVHAQPRAPTRNNSAVAQRAESRRQRPPDSRRRRRREQTSAGCSLPCPASQPERPRDFLYGFRGGPVCERQLATTKNRTVIRRKKLGPTSVCVYISFLVLGFAQLFPLYLCLRSDGGSRLLARRSDTDCPAG